MSCSHEFGLIYIFKQKTSTAHQNRNLLLFGGLNTSGLLSRSPPRLESMLSLAIIGGRQKRVTPCSGVAPRSGPITRGIG